MFMVPDNDRHTLAKNNISSTQWVVMLLVTFSIYSTGALQHHRSLAIADRTTKQSVAGDTMYKEYSV